MAHYNNLMKRETLVEKMPDIFNRTPSKVLSFINLCIYPHDFTVLYESVRKQERLSMPTYEALKGALIGLIVLSKRKHKDTLLSVDNYVLDFITFIRSDRVGDPVKFLLSMKAYMLRFMFVKGLQVAFGLDWRKLILESLELRSAPNPKSYHSLFTNVYIRNLLRVYVVWKNYRDVHDEDYEAGVNDVNTLLDKAAEYKTSLSREQLVSVFETLKENLPSWRYSTRKQAAYAIDTCQDGWDIVNRQFSDYRFKQVGVNMTEYSKRKEYMKAYSFEWRRKNRAAEWLRTTKARAKRNNIEFTLTLADFEEFVKVEVCPVFNIPLVLEIHDRSNSNVYNNPSRPTLDRFDNEIGYTRDNCWVISARANMLKKDATVKELQLLALAVTQKQTQG